MADKALIAGPEASAGPQPARGQKMYVDEPQACAPELLSSDEREKRRFRCGLRRWKYLKETSDSLPVPRIANGYLAYDEGMAEHLP
ncbi:MAG TPA: hypothetical protein VF704_13300 [Allosphingosinicella sp.]|jgi:hypothetical protein